MLEELLQKLNIEPNSIDLIKEAINNNYKPIEEFNNLSSELEGYKEKEAQRETEKKNQYINSLFTDIGITNEKLVELLIEKVDKEKITKNEEGNYTGINAEEFKKEFEAFIPSITVGGVPSANPPGVVEQVKDEFLEGFGSK